MFAACGWESAAPIARPITLSLTTDLGLPSNAGSEAGFPITDREGASRRKPARSTMVAHRPVLVRRRGRRPGRLLPATRRDTERSEATLWVSASPTAPVMPFWRGGIDCDGVIRFRRSVLDDHGTPVED